MAGKKIIVSVISELTTDQRVIRIANTLQDMGFDVLVMARKFSNSLPLEDYRFKTRRLHCYCRKGVLQYAEFNLKLFLRLLFSKTDYLLANDLDCLAPNFIVSNLRGKRLFYDTHEYFTGVPELRNAPFKKKCWRWLEKRMLPRLSIIYTVSQSVKKKYESDYPITLQVVRNLPVTPPPVTMAKPKHWAGKKVLLLQGMGINHGRGALELLDMMPFLPQHYHLVFIGGGLLWEDLQQLSLSRGLSHRIEMIPKLPPSQLKQYTPWADLGLSVDGFSDDNFLVSLPNKIFDYIQAGIPVAATALPEVKRIIEQHRVGFCFKCHDPAEMAKEVLYFLENQEWVAAMRQNTGTAAKILCWENEKEILVQIYQPYL